ncbi:MAG: hypothetical protein M3362_01870 [Acidobacteriota bacterium]|nr:hypothetical protein [Acidobacteriota bacterium]
MPLKSNAVSSNSEDRGKHEGAKLLHDACKHLTTLSSGSIVVLATFLTKSSPLKGTDSLLLTLVFFVLAVVCAVFAMFTLAVYVRDDTESGQLKRSMTMSEVLMSVGLASFLFGLIFLVVFVSKNL